LFTALYIATLIPALYFGFKRGGDFTTVAIVMIGNWALGLFVWSGSNPIMTNAMNDMLAAAFIAILCRETTCLIIGLLLALSATISIIYGICVAPETSYHVVYAYVISTMGHLQNLWLTFGGMDDGIRTRLREFIRRLGNPSWSRGLHHSRVAAKDRKRDG